MKSFKEAKAALAWYMPKDIHEAYTLERMVKLMAALGNPQNKLKVIHVAGTSGKTSTSYYIADLLKEAGKNVGLTVSPHVYEINERMQINLTPLSENEFCLNLSQFINLFKKSGVKPTYYELLVAFAYWYFAKKQVDYAVVEVGLGGLLDATNVVNRADKVCVITDIGLDHTEVLGKTLDEIIHQKTGIVQPGNQVFTLEQTPEITSSIEKDVQARGGELSVISPQTEKIKNLPLFQRRNWQLAEAVFDFVAKRDVLSQLDKKQLAKARDIVIPARMEILKLKAKTVVLDGAHNAQKMRILTKTMQEKFGNQPIATLLAIKNGQDFVNRVDLTPIIHLSSQIIVTSFHGLQDFPVKSVDPGVLAQHIKKLGAKNVEVISDPKTGFKSLQARSEPILLVTGSFYLMSHIRPLLR